MRGEGYSDEFGVGVGVHQGSVLSPMLFIIVLEALSLEFLTGCPWVLLYADYNSPLTQPPCHDPLDM